MPVQRQRAQQKAPGGAHRPREGAAPTAPATSSGRRQPSHAKGRGPATGALPVQRAATAPSTPTAPVAPVATPARRPSVRRWVALAVVLVLAAVGAALAMAMRAAPLERVPSSAPPTPLPAGPVQEDPANPLPFNMPPGGVLKASGHKVFAHYFTPYPVSLDNQPPGRDYYALNYLSPGGESGKHRAYGGLLRDRPDPVPVSGAPDWQLENYKTEIARASRAGIDGFVVDVLALDGYNWTRVKLLTAAAEQSGTGFSVVPMIDATSLQAADSARIAAAMADLARSPATYRLADGRVVISAFIPENFGAGWWSDWLNQMSTQYGQKVAFVPCFLNYAGNADAFESISYGFADWGSRSPAANTDLARSVDDAHRRGKIWMQPVSAQDERPSQGVYDESNNTENLRTTWMAAIDGADWVQMVTWNDYSEGTQFAPSVEAGSGLLDISSYYLSRFKTGTWPAVVRDTLYLTHRVQFWRAVPTGGQRVLMQLRSGSSPARDVVEVLAFLARPGTVRTVVGGRVEEHAVDAGVTVLHSPLQAGTVAGEVLRDGAPVVSMTSPFVVRDSVDVQDLSYRIVGSRDQPASAEGAPR